MAPKITKKSRNLDLICGIEKYSRSTTYHKRGLWAIKAKNDDVFPRHDKKSATAEPPAKPPKFYPADDVKKPLVNKRKPKPTKLSLPVLDLGQLLLDEIPQQDQHDEESAAPPPHPQSRDEQRTPTWTIEDDNIEKLLRDLIQLLLPKWERKRSWKYPPTNP